MSRATRGSAQASVLPRPSTAAFDAEVIDIVDLSPTFRRITFGGAGMADFGIAHHPRDQRFKLIIPPGGGAPVFDLVDHLAQQDAIGVSWFQAWRCIDPDVRGSMRTYTIRQWRDAQRELVVDMVLHTDADGHSGPASHWARHAEIGSQLQLIGPCRHGEPSLGAIEFHPGGAKQVLLVGDESAVPAIASILDHLDGTDVCGQAILEVPTADDVQTLHAPVGIDVQWLPRRDCSPGALTEAAVRDLITATAPPAPTVDLTLDEADLDAQLLWDVPSALTQAAHASTTRLDDRETENILTDNDRSFYAWIAGEASTVKTLRRYLVREVGVDRRHVAFMGYWRDGAAEGD